MMSSPLYILFIIFSSIMCMIFNSWLLIWIMLEINTLSFCSLLKDFSPKKKKSTEMSMKYFIIQSISSSILLFMILWMKSYTKIFLLLLFLAFLSLMIKMASAPFQQWFVKMVKEMKWKNNFLLMTWQKIAPVYLLIYQMKFFIFPFIFFGAILGSVFQINKKNTMEIMAYSSVFNLSWMLIAIYMNMKILIYFSFFYWMTVFLVLHLLVKFNFWNLSSESSMYMKKWVSFMLIINLAGIPPFLGFISKWITFSEILLNKMLFICTLLLVVSSLNLYIYLRMFNYLMIKNSNFLQKNYLKMSYFFMSFSFLVNMFPIIFIIL